MLAGTLSFVLAAAAIGGAGPQATPSGAADSSDQAKVERSWTLHAKTLYTSKGDALENALIVVTDGKITAISPGAEPTSDAVEAAVVTAGMIDASARIHVGSLSVEQSSCLLYTSPSPRDQRGSRMPSSA